MKGNEPEERSEESRGGVIVACHIQGWDSFVLRIFLCFICVSVLDHYMNATLSHRLFDLADISFGVDGKPSSTTAVFRGNCTQGVHGCRVNQPLCLHRQESRWKRWRLTSPIRIINCSNLVIKGWVGTESWHLQGLWKTDGEGEKRDWKTGRERRGQKYQLCHAKKKINKESNCLAPEISNVTMRENKYWFIM